jgi:hypothetical protein
MVQPFLVPEVQVIRASPGRAPDRPVPMGRLGYARSPRGLPRHQCFLSNEKPVLLVLGRATVVNGRISCSGGAGRRNSIATSARRPRCAGLKPSYRSTTSADRRYHSLQPGIWRSALRGWGFAGYRRESLAATSPGEGRQNLAPTRATLDRRAGTICFPCFLGTSWPLRRFTFAQLRHTGCSRPPSRKED